MAWQTGAANTFGRPNAGLGGAGAAGGGGFGAGGFRSTTTFGQPTANRFGAGGGGGFGQSAAAPTGFGKPAAAPTGGFGGGGGGGFGAVAGGGLGQPAQPTGFGQPAQPTGFGQPQPQQQQGGNAPSYQPSSVMENGAKFEVRAITAMDFYSQYSFEQLRWLNMRDPSTRPPLRQQAQAGGFGAATGAAGGFARPTLGAAGGFGQQQQQQQQVSGFGQTATTGGFGAKPGGFGQPAATGGFGAKPGGFGTTATAGGFGQTQQPQTGGFGQPAATGGFGAKPGGFGTTATAGGFGQTQQPQTGGFGQPAATGGFGAKPGGFGTTATTGGFGQQQQQQQQQQPAVGGFGGGFGQQQQQPVFQQPGAAATTGGFGAKPGGFGTGLGATGLRAANGAQGVRPAFGQTATSTYGQPGAAVGSSFGTQSSFARPGGLAFGTGQQQQAAPEPTLYTDISSAPFGILPKMLKEAATATPKGPTAEQKSSITATTPATSASKRKQMMLPHYKLTPRSELASAPSRLLTAAGGIGGTNEAVEAAGRDMFASKLGGVKKLMIEPSDSEQSALFNPAERARLRQGGSVLDTTITTSSSVPATPSSSAHYYSGAMSAFASPGIFATPSYPRSAMHAGPIDSSGVSTMPLQFPGYPTLADGMPSTPGGAVPPISIYASPAGPLTSTASGSSTMTSPLMAANPFAPKLTKPNCYTIPSISELRRMSTADLSRIPEFTVGHTQFGSVTWKTPTDVRELNLDELCDFSQDSLDIYPDGSPPDGVLNKAATITIFNVSVDIVLKKARKERRGRKSPGRESPASSRSLTPEEIEIITQTLKKETEASDGIFKEFNPDGNRWTFEVKHFTRYGLGAPHPSQQTTSSTYAGAQTHSPASTTQSSPARSPSKSSLLHSSRHARPAPSGRKGLRDDSSIDASSHDDDDGSSVKPLLVATGDEQHLSGDDAMDTHDDSELDEQLDDLSGDDEEDEEEEFGEDELDENGDFSDSSEHSHHRDEDDGYHSDFSHSDSTSTHAQQRRNEDRMQGDKDDDKTGLPSRHRRQLHSKSHAPHSSHQQRIVRDSYRDAAPHRDGAESRFPRPQPLSQHAPPTQHQQSVRSTPFLAKQLGLNAKEMHQMQANFFPSLESKFQSTKRSTNDTQFTSATPWDHQHVSKRFKSTEPVSEVKMQAPRGFALGRFPGHFSASKAPLEADSRSSYQQGTPTKFDPSGDSSRIGKPRTQDALTFDPVPLSNSLTKDASEVTIDPMLYQGRSSRVCWTPHGTIYCPSFTAVNHFRVTPAATSVAPSLVPSLEAHQKLSQLSYSKLDSASPAQTAPETANQTSLPSLRLNDNWNAFVNQQIGLVSSQFDEVVLALSSAMADAPRDSTSDSDPKQQRTALQRTLHEAYYKYKTELSVWKMLKTLFGESKYAPTLDRYEGTPVEEHVTGLVRKHQLDQLLCELTLDDVKRDLLEMTGGDAKFDSTTHKHWATLFTLLTGKRVQEAVELAMQMGERRLALLLTQAADPTTLHLDMRKQLHSWSKEGAITASNLEPYKLAVFSILAGEIRVVASENKIPDWLRSFAMFFWYSGPNSFAQPLETVIDMYSALCTTTPPTGATKTSESDTSLNLAAPVPPYARAFPSLAHENQHDVLFHLLQVYRDRENSLDGVLHPLANSPRILDFSLSWFLLTVCQSAHIGTLPHRRNEIIMSFATQLEMSGLWTWSLYVLFSLPSSHESLRNHAVRDVLFRHAEALETAGILSPITQTVDELEVSRFFHLDLHQDVRIPSVWLYEAFAQLYQYRGDWMSELGARLKAQQWEEAHDLVVSRWAPKVILDFGANADSWPTKFIQALEQLEAHSSVTKLMTSMDFTSAEEHSSEISNWLFGGNVFLTYHRWYLAVKQARIAWQSSIDTVDHQLLAQLNRDASDFIALINEYTASLQAGVSILQVREMNQRRYTNANANGKPTVEEDWSTLSGPAGISLRQRRLDLISLPMLKQQLFCASELSARLISSIADLKLLIACIDSDAALPPPESQHLVPLSSYEMIDSIEPLQQALITPDQLSSNLSVLTSRYLDWRVSTV